MLPPPLLDADIRPALTAWVRARDPHARILEEVGVLHGDVRVDLAAFSPRRLHGYEVKSDVDSARRLARQVAAYSKVLDRCTLVVGEKLGRAWRGASTVPPWWGILLAGRLEGRVEIVELRSATPNPEVEPLALAQLLWRDEALRLLRQVGAGRGLSGVPRKKLYQRLSEVLPLPPLQHHVRRVLLERREWSGRVR